MPQTFLDTDIGNRSFGPMSARRRSTLPAGAACFVVRRHLHLHLNLLRLHFRPRLGLRLWGGLWLWPPVDGPSCDVKAPAGRKAGDQASALQKNEAIFKTQARRVQHPGSFGAHPLGPTPGPLTLANQFSKKIAHKTPVRSPLADRQHTGGRRRGRGARGGCGG